jgi:general secretion pathway protein A
MYVEFFNLKGRPFQLTPDFRFFYESQTHRKAISYLTYGLHQREGFVVVTGEVGAGKTTLIEFLLSKLDRTKYAVTKIVTTNVQPDDLLHLIAEGFGLKPQGESKAALLTRLCRHFESLAARNMRPLLIVDEVQNLTLGSIEELRMLSNFQAHDTPFLQTFFIGQPQFRETMASKDLEQLMQRVIATHHLQPLTPKETQGYIEHRLHRVGWTGAPSFAEGAFQRIFEETGGIPRRMNLFCDRMLLACFLAEQREVDFPILEEVASDLRQQGLLGSRRYASDETGPLTSDKEPVQGHL